MLKFSSRVLNQITGKNIHCFLFLNTFVYSNNFSSINNERILFAETPIMSQNIPTLEQFDCEGEPNSLCTRWEKWKRGLEIYFQAANIDTSAKKRASLLHIGGLALQDVYFNIPGAHVEEKESVDVYKIAIEKLNEYFAPKQSNLFERHLFRLMRQEPGEKFEKFLVRLRRQSAKCNFSNDNESLIDQITEKCLSTDLRKRILVLGDTVTVDKIIAEANALETVERQMIDFQDKQNVNVNKIDTVKNRSINEEKIECTRCGSKNHKFDSDLCVAKDKTCAKCGYKGHFLKMCRTRANKRKPNPRDQKTNSKKRRFEKNDTEGPSGKKNKSDAVIDYIFHIDEDAAISCQIGGVDVDLLIDSGSKCNIISEKSWNLMKAKNVIVTNQEKKPDKTFMSYGSKDPLTVLGSFEAEICVGPETILAKFYVIKDGVRNLLGKDSAITLKVLKLGLQVNEVSVTKFPKFKNIVLKIAIDKTVTPVCQPYRRVPIPLEVKINNKIDELMEMDIIEPVNEPSPWVSPMVPVLKEDGDVRICLDMRCANKAIIREHHILPTMHQLMPKFRKAKFFSKLDVCNAFHQVEIAENCREITTFITSKGLYRYKRLMFGISSAPEHFQKIMEHMLIKCQGVANFIDDIIVCGRDEKEHDENLKNVLHVLKVNNVLLNNKKCLFKAREIEFLGHRLSADGIRPLDKYIKTIESFREPKNVEEIQSFLGLINFVGKWIPNLATLTEPIREILRKKLHKHADIFSFWTVKQQRAYDQLKQCLSKIDTLGYYDPDDRTQVIADASPVGLGAVLIQYDSTGPRIIAFGNKSLTDVEKRYCQTEKEALALVWAIEHFHMYLYGKEFELVTDHKPLEVIFKPRSKPCARIERWVLRLQAYNYKVVYKPGKSNIADPLSRLCTNQNSASFDSEYHINQIVQYARPTALSLKSISEASKSDKDFILVRDGLHNNKWDQIVNNYKLFEKELWLHDDLLLRGNKIVIPSKLRQEVLAAAHEGHPGIVNMKARLRTKVWWPKIDKDAENVVKNCKGCILVSGPNPPTPMKRRELPIQAWVDTAVDFLGPLPSGDYLFVIIDYFSRYKEIKIMRSITAKDTINVLKEIFSRLGIPVTLTCDNGRQFISQEFKLFCEELGVRIYNTIPYWPQQNGEVERQNRDILKRLKISQIQKSDWKDDLLKYLMMYNSTPHGTTGKSPSELFYGRLFRDKLPSLICVENMDLDLEVRDKDTQKKEKGKINEDRKRKAKEQVIEVGEKVYVKNFVKSNKLTPNFDPEPHTVVSTRGNEANVRNDSTGQEFKRNVIHLKRVEGNWTVVDTESNDEHFVSDDDHNK